MDRKRRPEMNALGKAWDHAMMRVVEVNKTSTPYGHLRVMKIKVKNAEHNTKYT